MDGITVLNEIVIDNTDGLIAGIVMNGLMIILALVILILSIKGLKDDNCPICVLTLIIAILTLFVGITILPLSISSLSDPPIVQYEVVISDNVSFTEFTEKYERIEQRGEIYVVQEKEAQED